MHGMYAWNDLGTPTLPNVSDDSYAVKARDEYLGFCRTDTKEGRVKEANVLAQKMSSSGIELLQKSAPSRSKKMPTLTQPLFEGLGWKYDSALNRFAGTSDHVDRP